MSVKKPGKEEKGKGNVLAFATGKRKRAIARARFIRGKGIVRVNSEPLELIKNELVRMTISEPLVLSGDGWKGLDIRVNARGGGVMGQAEASRQAIARGLVQRNPGLKKKFMEYDRNLLVSDPRRTEPHKPPRSSQGPRRAKQKSKR